MTSLATERFYIPRSTLEQVATHSQPPGGQHIRAPIDSVSAYGRFRSATLGEEVCYRDIPLGYRQAVPGVDQRVRPGAERPGPDQS